MSTLQENNQHGLTATATKVAKDALRHIGDASSMTGSIFRTGKSKVEKHETIERTKDKVEVLQYAKSLPEDERAICEEVIAEIKGYNIW